MKIKYSLLLVLLLCARLSFAQNSGLAIGEWKSYLVHGSSKAVVTTPNNIIYAMERDLLMINRDDESISFVSKVEGLSDTEVVDLAYNEEFDIVIIAYANSNIDLLTPSGVVNISDIKQSNAVIGDKRIYDIYIENDAAFLATGFGIVKINLLRAETEFTTFTNLKINSLTKWNNRYYAASDEGIYSVPISGTNLLDFNNWTLLENGFPLFYATQEVEVFNDKLYLDVNDTLQVYDGNNLTAVKHIENHEISYITKGIDKLIVGFLCPSFCGSQALIIDNQGNINDVLGDCVSYTLGATEPTAGKIWFADGIIGLRRYEPDFDYCEIRRVNTPFTHKVFDIEIQNEELWLGTGTINFGYQFGFNRNGFASLIKGEWRYYNDQTLVNYTDIIDIASVAIQPSTNEVWLASYGDGLLHYTRGTDSVAIYDETNSPLETFGGSPRVADIEFDDDENLWICNYGVENFLTVKTPTGEFIKLNTSSFPVNTAAQIDFANNGDIWVAFGENGLGVFEIDENFNIINSRHFTQSNSALPTNSVNTLRVDLEGDIWVGTTKGAVVFECGNSFTSNCQGTQRIVVREDGNNALLLETESIRAIAIDGANRKWFGTNNGIFVQSPDGLLQVARYQIDNSPLFDNVITDIEINPNTGEVFIGTADGILSLQGDAIVARQIHAPEVYAYPNPVTSDYEGPIAIKGVPSNANIKITDINGTLVFETTSLGGQVIWDGNDYNGRRVNSGVYLVFSTNDNINNIEAYATKILVLN